MAEACALFPADWADLETADGATPWEDNSEATLRDAMDEAEEAEADATEAALCKDLDATEERDEADLLTSAEYATTL